MNTYFLSILRQSAIWTLALGFWALMRQFGQELVDEPPQSPSELVIIHISLGVLCALIFSGVDRVMNKRIGSLNTFGKVLLVRSLSYLLVFLAVTILGVIIYTAFDENGLSTELIVNFLFSREIILLFFYFFLVAFIIHFVKQIDKKFGPGNLWNMLIGKFHKPTEVQRIIMFLDLKSSTSIAERIGHLKYSNLIQDCFQDLNVILNYKAEIYQYVGDEVVLLWTKQNGISNSNSIKAFFAFQNRIQERTHYYTSKYGLVPEFKAGCHIGKVVVAEVGEIKREIAYHGDAINTASRIQGECNRLKEQFLISEELYKIMDKTDQYELNYADQVLLKGKTQDVKIFSVSSK